MWAPHPPAGQPAFCGSECLEVSGLEGLLMLLSISKSALSDAQALLYVAAPPRLLWLFQSSLGSLSEAPAVTHHIVLRTWSHFFPLGRRPRVSLALGTFPMLPSLQGPAHLHYCCFFFFFASSQNGFFYDRLCLKASLKPPDPPRQLTLTPRVPFWRAGLASLLDSFCLCWVLGLLAPISGLPSLAPVIALLPALETGLRIPSSSPRGRSCEGRASGQDATRTRFLSSCSETHPFPHSCVKRSQMPILNV